MKKQMGKRVKVQRRKSVKHCKQTRHLIFNLHVSKNCRQNRKKEKEKTDSFVSFVFLVTLENNPLTISCYTSLLYNSMISFLILNFLFFNY